MRLNGKFVTQLTAQDLLQLVTDGRTEDQTLDFKVSGYEGKDWGAELAKDVMAMANAQGGVVLIGVGDEGDRATAVPGVELTSGGKDPMEAYERSLRARLEPPVPGLQIVAIPVGDEGRSVVAIGVPASVSRPHRTKITGEGSGRGRWTVRRNRNVDDMTYSEIRGAFVEAATVEQRVREFHSKRCQEARSWARGNGFGEENGLMLLHVVPLSAEVTKLDILKALPLTHLFFPPGEPGMKRLLPDLDGVSAEIQIGPPREWWGWVKIFRNGCVEGVMGNYVHLEGEEGDRGRRRLLNHRNFEHDVLRAVRGYIEGLTTIGYNPPFAVSLSLLNGQGSYLNHPRAHHARMLTTTVASLEPALIDYYDEKTLYHAEMRRTLDQLWNAYGAPCCASYDEEGAWRGLR